MYELACSPCTAPISHSDETGCLDNLIAYYLVRYTIVSIVGAWLYCSTVRKLQANRHRPHCTVCGSSALFPVLTCNYCDDTIDYSPYPERDIYQATELIMAYLVGLSILSGTPVFAVWIQLLTSYCVVGVGSSIWYHPDH